MRYIIGIAAVICCGWISRVTLDLEIVRSNKYLGSRSSDEYGNGKKLTEKQIRTGVLLLTLLAALTVIQLVCIVHDSINFLKLCIALVVLTGCACVDVVEHRIPNVLSGLLALSASLLLMIGFLTGQEGALGYLKSSLFATAVSVACLTLGSILSHQGIGMGDIKLIAGVALTGGTIVVGGTLFFAMLFCAIFSVFLLIMKKKTLKESVPFGPFLLIGYILTIFVLKF